jgi:DNA gyrase subunit A
MSDENNHEHEEELGIISVSIESEMQSSYLEYAMSVIISRALPDVRDGLKPVHRRILYSMNESGCYYNKPYRKSARIVGEVMGRYHPHGDTAIYDSLVRMAQDFSLRLPLVDGQGNFGSIDGDSAAAMRYTESRLAKSAHPLLEDIDKDTVNFQDNYDNSSKEPTVLPARFPNVLANGSGGIAVGMATNIPPFNLGEIIDACCLYIKNPSITSEELLGVVQGPDFPTGGLILGKTGIISAITTGRGSVLMRGKTEIETLPNGKQAIIITEIPYMVNKSKMIEKIADLAREKRLEGISDLRDESDKRGIRVVIEIKKDAMPEIVLNLLYSLTPLQTSFGVNMLALDHGKPRIMNVLEVIRLFIEFREEVVSRRTKYLLEKARNKGHLAIGLFISVNNIDEVIALIKGSADVTAAKEALLAREWNAENVGKYIELVGDQHNKVINSKCKFTEEQAKAILEMRLQKLTAMEKNKIAEELENLALEINKYITILESRDKLFEIIHRELLEVKEEFATPRKTQIEMNEFEHDIEDLIQKEDMVVTVTHNGYIKRCPLSTYRSQKRGGKGRSALSMREEDITTELFVASTHAPVLFFSNHGKVYKLKVYKLPIGSTQSKGRALVNILPLAQEEKITNVMILPEDEKTCADMSIMFATMSGSIRRNDLSDFYRIQSNGKIAMKLDEGDKLIAVHLCKDHDHILLSTMSGKCVRFPVSAARVFKSRMSSGVRGIKFAVKDDKVVSMSIIKGIVIDFEDREKYLKLSLNTRIKIAKSPEDKLDKIIAKLNTDLTKETIVKYAKAEQFILTVTENGYGKRTSSYEYRVTNRGGKGIVSIITSSRNGKVVSSFPVTVNDQIMLITDQGTLIRCPVHDIRTAGRNTQGVTLFRTAKKEKIVSIALIPEEEDDKEELDTGIKVDTVDKE